MTFLSDRWQSFQQPRREAGHVLPVPQFGVQPPSPRIFGRLFEASAKELDLPPLPVQETVPARFAA